MLLVINALNRGEQGLEPEASGLAEGESVAAHEAEEAEVVPYVRLQTSHTGDWQRQPPARRTRFPVDAVHQADLIGWSRRWPVDDWRQGDGDRNSPAEVLRGDGTSDLELVLNEIAEDVLRCWLDNDGGVL